MNKDNVAKLVTALRSGDYSQTAGKLSEGDGSGYCCLGVACDISGLGEWDYGANGRYYVIKDENGNKLDSSDNVLPRAVARWLGIAEDGTLYLPVPHYAFDNREGTEEEEYLTTPMTGLTDLNDEGMSFAQIADMLENADAFVWSPAPGLPENDDDVNIS